MADSDDDGQLMRRRDRRAILEALGGGAYAETGPFAEGLSDTDTVVVTSFYHPRICRRFRRALAEAGVDSTVRVAGIKSVVEVRYADLETTYRVLACQQRDYPDRRAGGIRRDIDFTVFGALFGAIFGVGALGYSSQIYVRVFAWMGFIVTGMIIGAIADRTRRGYRYEGRLRFGIMDCLLFTAAIAVVLAIWVFLFNLTSAISAGRTDM